MLKQSSAKPERNRIDLSSKDLAPIGVSISEFHRNSLNRRWRRWEIT